MDETEDPMITCMHKMSLCCHGYTTDDVLGAAISIAILACIDMEMTKEQLVSAILAMWTNKVTLARRGTVQ